jgi:hypothetical protein
MAPAMHEAFTVVTLDPVFRAYGVPVLWWSMAAGRAFPCQLVRRLA